MLSIAIVNLKGGSTKTTSAAYLLHALAESGLSVLGVDADPENCSLVRWSDLARWEIPVVGMPVKDLHRRWIRRRRDRHAANGIWTRDRDISRSCSVTHCGPDVAHAHGLRQAACSP